MSREREMECALSGERLGLLQSFGVVTEGKMTVNNIRCTLSTVQFPAGCYQCKCTANISLRRNKSFRTTKLDQLCTSIFVYLQQNPY